MKYRWLLIALAAALTGCAKKEAPEAARTPPQEQESTARTLVDGFTGRAAVRTGKEARRTIEAVSAQQRDDLDAVMGGQ